MVLFASEGLRLPHSKARRRPRGTDPSTAGRGPSHGAACRGSSGSIALFVLDWGRPDLETDLTASLPGSPTHCESPRGNAPRSCRGPGARHSGPGLRPSPPQIRSFSPNHLVSRGPSRDKERERGVCARLLHAAQRAERLLCSGAGRGARRCITALSPGVLSVTGPPGAVRWEFSDVLTRHAAQKSLFELKAGFWPQRHIVVRLRL